MFFDRVPKGALDPIFGLTAAFREDPRPNKVNLLVGIYQNEALQPEPLSSVQKVRLSHLAEYLPIDGIPSFVKEIASLALGSAWTTFHSEIYGAQTVGGTGALRVGAEFLAQEVGRVVYLPEETWPNHQQIFERAGFEIRRYVGYDRKRRAFDLELMQKSLANASGIVLFHASCQNPTGADPTEEEWKQLSIWMEGRALFPFFDFAYQGFGRGIGEDRRAIEIFAEQAEEFMVAYSCSKNFGLYGERVGALFVKAKTADVKNRIGSQVRRIIRANVSNPPTFGARVALEILQHDKGSWERDVEQMRDRLNKMRRLYLEIANNPDLEPLKNGKGMFLFLGLKREQTQVLIDKFGIYMPDNGRLNLAGLNEQNVRQVVQAISSV